MTMLTLSRVGVCCERVSVAMHRWESGGELRVERMVVLLLLGTRLSMRWRASALVQ